MKKRSPFLLLLPNLFTASSIFCGLYAIIQATDSTVADRYYLAAVAILFAVVFDSADGRVARMTRTQTAFGVQFDSLADLISFGVAPAVLVYEWALHHLGILGMLVGFVYAACGAVRLARFNVMAARQKKVPKFFTGLPIPLSAVSIVSLVLLHHRMGGVQLDGQPLMVGVMLLLSALMVSNIRYRTFKAVKSNRLAVSSIVALATMAFVAAWKTSFSLVLMVSCAGLIALGPAEELVRFVRRRLPGAEQEKK